MPAEKRRPRQSREAYSKYGSTEVDARRRDGGIVFQPHKWGALVISLSMLYAMEAPRGLPSISLTYIDESIARAAPNTHRSRRRPDGRKTAQHHNAALPSDIGLLLTVMHETCFSDRAKSLRSSRGHATQNLHKTSDKAETIKIVLTERAQNSKD